MKQWNNRTMEDGVSLYFSLIIMTISLAISFGLGTILLRQLEMVRGMGDSVIAFYAADTGIEKIMMDRDDPLSVPPIDECFAPPNDDICYKVDVYSPGGADCPVGTADYFCIKSVGSFRETKRAIEVAY